VVSFTVPAFGGRSAIRTSSSAITGNGTRCPHATRPICLASTKLHFTTTHLLIQEHGPKQTSPLGAVQVYTHGQPGLLQQPLHAFDLESR